MSKFAAVILVALISLVSTVVAVTDYFYDNNDASYSGQSGRDRRIYDPYSRDRYFGVGYERDFLNWGMKGPTDRMMTTGAKSAYSSVFNLDTNALSNRGRDPSAISNWDPGMKGYNRIDRAVTLLPFNAVDESLANNAVYPKGTARMFSSTDQFGSGSTVAYPASQVWITTINLPPIGENEIYQAWLGDDETEYMMSLGFMKSGAGITSQLIMEINRLINMFDYVAITREPYPDLDPTPGQIVLLGRVDPSRAISPIDLTMIERMR